MEKEQSRPLGWRSWVSQSMPCQSILKLSKLLITEMSLRQRIILSQSRMEILQISNMLSSVPAANFLAGRRIIVCLISFIETEFLGIRAAPRDEHTQGSWHILILRVRRTRREGRKRRTKRTKRKRNTKIRRCVTRARDCNDHHDIELEKIFPAPVSSKADFSLQLYSLCAIDCPAALDISFSICVSLEACKVCMLFWDFVGNWKKAGHFRELTRTDTVCQIHCMPGSLYARFTACQIHSFSGSLRLKIADCIVI